jgi:hypothetical protein
VRIGCTLVVLALLGAVSAEAQAGSAAAGRRESAENFVDLYYQRISSQHFLNAWKMLSPHQKRQVGPFHSWKVGFRGSRGITLLSGRASLGGQRTVVRLRLRSRDLDVCSHSIVRQYFAGSVTLVAHRGSWLIDSLRIRKTHGMTPRLSRSACPAPNPPPPPPPPPPPDGQNCQGYDPCLPPGGDVDCAGGSGDGPRYVNGPVRVTGSDPYGLDGDGDGIACE